MNTKKRVGVTGYGALSSLGENTDEIWQSIKDKKLGYNFYEYEDPSVNAKFFGLIKENKNRYRPYKKRILRALPEYAKYALCAAGDAFRMPFPLAQPTDYYDPFDIAVIAGTGWGGCS